MGNEPGPLYESLDFPLERAGPNRPYTFINMVTTIDSKIVTGNRGEPVQDLGSDFDHKVMRAIQRAADAIMIGAGSQRSSDKITYPDHLLRFVVTQSGNLLYESRFFNDDSAKAFVLCPHSTTVPDYVQTLRVGQSKLDFVEAFSRLKKECGIEKLLVEGGSDLNAQLLALDLVDELFLTIAPKVKLGKDIPTYADGEPLPREQVQRYSLLELHRVGDEVFLRYRRL